LYKEVLDAKIRKKSDNLKDKEEKMQPCEKFYDELRTSFKVFRIFAVVTLNLLEYEKRL
jgi:hypothetical protein